VKERVEAAKHGGPAMPVLYLPFFAPTAKMAAMKEAFPRTTFRCTSDTSHDHPWAHTETMIGSNTALRMVPAGHTIIDLFGKPKSADKFRKTQARSNKPKVMIGYQALKTERDYVRSLDWGDEVADDGTLRYLLGNGDPTNDPLMPITDEGVTIDGEMILGKELTWLCNHTLYYLTDEQIVTLLKPKRSRMIAVVHRHPSDNGSLFMDEMTYAKRFGMVEQINTHTGERYVHRDLSFFWTAQNKTVYTSVGNYSWTFHKVSDTTWILVLTKSEVCDERYAARVKDLGLNGAAYELNEHNQAPTKFEHPSLAVLPHTEVTMIGSIPVVRILGGTLILRLTNIDFFDFLATKMIGRPRTPEILADLYSIARSSVDVSAATVGGRSYRVAWHDVSDHVGLAFLSGLARETELLRAIETYSSQRKEHVALSNGRSIFQVGVAAPETFGRSLLTTAKHFNSVRKHTDTFTGLLEALD